MQSSAVGNLVGSNPTLVRFLGLSKCDIKEFFFRNCVYRWAAVLVLYFSKRLMLRGGEDLEVGKKRLPDKTPGSNQ